jgi:hypothetical protein
MEVAMRTIATTLMAAGWLVMGANASDAQTYPWCAVYHDKFGAWNCGFVTFEQCLATVRGIGGMCSQNPAYQAELAAKPRRKVRRHRG